MTKQIEIHGQRVQLSSLDEGRTLVEQPAIVRCLRIKEDVALGITKEV